MHFETSRILRIGNEVQEREHNTSYVPNVKFTENVAVNEKKIIAPRFMILKVLANNTGTREKYASK